MFPELTGGKFPPELKSQKNFRGKGIFQRPTQGSMKAPSSDFLQVTWEPGETHPLWSFSHLPPTPSHHHYPSTLSNHRFLSKKGNCLKLKPLWSIIGLVAVGRKWRRGSGKRCWWKYSESSLPGRGGSELKVGWGVRGLRLGPSSATTSQAPWGRHLTSADCPLWYDPHSLPSSTFLSFINIPVNKPPMLLTISLET